MPRTTSSVPVFVCFSLVVCFALTQASHAQDPTILPTDDPATVTLSSETANNTSACVAKGNPSYCSAALPSLKTSIANQMFTPPPETTTVDASPGHVSIISLHRLMYNGWPGKIICEYQPWFDDTGNFNGHINIGYDETDIPTVAFQDQDMINRGCDIDFIDFDGSATVNPQFNLQATNAVYSDLWPRLKNNVYPLKFAILEDEYALKGPCAGKTHDDTVACIKAALKADMFYINQNYVLPHPGLYWTDQTTGQTENIIGYFGACADFVDSNNQQILSCPSDWEAIWGDVQSYVDANLYSFKFVFQFGDFNIPALAPPSITTGEYAWPQPYTDPTGDADSFQDNPSSQYNWCDANLTCIPGSQITNAYLDNFYYQGAQSTNSTKLTIALLYSGFDDSNASWTKGRVIAQQCGQVLLDSANEASKNYYWPPQTTAITTRTIPYMQVATWNDYEEGSEQESGIDNCYTVTLNPLSPPNTTASWTLNNPNNDSHATPATIHHFTVWTATPPGSTNLKFGIQVLPSKLSQDLSKIPGLSKGVTYDVYLEMVGQPSIQNRMSNKISYTK